MKRQHGLIITKEFSLMRIMAIVGVLGGLIIGLIAFQSYRDNRSRADIAKVTPSPFVFTTTVPSPRTVLSPSYIRLVSNKDVYGYDEVVPVDVYLDTNNEEVVELTVVLSYDAELFAIEPKDIIAAETFKAINVNEIGKDTLSFSLFVTPTVGHGAVQLSQETKVATLNFRSRVLESTEAEIGVLFDPDETSESSLIPANTSPGEAKNILQSVEGVQIRIGN